MISRPRALWWMAVTVWAGLAATPASAKVKFRPYVDVQTRYDDNIFLESSGPDASQFDMSIVITPGASIEWPVWDLFLQAFYQVGFGFYLDFGDNNYMTHTLGALARYTPFEDLSFGVADTLEISTLPQAGNETFVYNKIQGQAKYEWLSGLGTSLVAHTSSYDDPSPSAAGNFEEVGMGVAQGYDISTRTSVGLSYDYATRSFVNRPAKDYDSQVIRAPTRFALFRNGTLWVSPGYHMRSYATKSFSSPILSTKVGWKPTNHELSLGYDYDVVDTFEELQSEEFEGLSTTFASEKTYSELRTYAADYSHVYRNKISATWLWDFVKKTALVTEGTYQINDYNNEIEIMGQQPDRLDNVMIGTVGIQQKFKVGESLGLLVILKYTHLRRDSNIAEEDYSANRVSAEIMGSF